MSEERAAMKSPVGEADKESADRQLRDRVQSLRLPQHVESGSSGSWIAWGLCLIFAGTTAAFAYLYYIQQPMPAASEPATAAKPSPSAHKPSAATPVATTASSGSVALEAKGYIIPAHQILVSPKVNGMVVKLRHHGIAACPKRRRVGRT